jgi:protein tyrosine/serine phosphatase
MNKHRLWQTGLLITILLSLSGITYHFLPGKNNNQAKTSTSIVPVTSRQWATDVNIEGVPNCHKVSEDLYRGAQPSEEGMKQLEKFGIKTVVNLRAFHSDRDELKDANLSGEHISVKPWHPEDEDVVRFLKIVTDKSRTPVFVHCQYGADRTGTMCAIYRIAVQGWSKDEAIEEMTKGNFGFHEIWTNLVDYIRGLDTEKIKQQVGIKQAIADN